jgi:hypothetical protein
MNASLIAIAIAVVSATSCTTIEAPATGPVPEAQVTTTEHTTRTTDPWSGATTTRKETTTTAPSY